MVGDAESIAEHIRFLKRRILGNEVVHHATLPARSACLVRDLSGLPPAMARILEIARIPALYTHQAEGILLRKGFGKYQMLETPCLFAGDSHLTAISSQVAPQGRGNLAQLCQNLRLARCLLGLLVPIQVDVE